MNNNHVHDIMTPPVGFMIVITCLSGTTWMRSFFFWKFFVYMFQGKFMKGGDAEGI